MVSPGTGAGMQARALRQLEPMIRNLMRIGAELGPAHPAFNAIATASKALSGAMNMKEEPKAAQSPIPVPATPPGSGVGGIGKPPTGLPSPAGGGAGPIAPMSMD